MSAKKSIHDLPDEVLLHIFEFLDGTTVQDCCLVAKRWNFIISSSPSTMKKVVLNLATPSWIPKIEEILNIQREFHTIYIHQSNQTFTYATKKILSKHGAKLRHFKLINAEISNLEDLLKQTPQLESLELEKITLTNKKQAPISLPKLKDLKINEVTDGILNLFSTPQLLSFKVSTFMSQEILQNFLMSQPALKSVTISHKSLQIFFNCDVTKFPFKLKQFHILAPGIQAYVWNENMRQFLLHQASSLEDLAVTLHGGPENFSTVLTQLPKLKTLSTSVDYLPDESSFYCCMSPLENVTTLTLKGKFSSREIAKSFMVNFPNVKKLDLKSIRSSLWFPKFLKFIAATQKQVEVLAISNLYKGTPLNLHFENLKSFSVNSIYKQDFFLNFVLSHRKLEEISVLDKNQRVKVKNVEDLFNLPLLRKITYNGDIECAREIWKIAKVNFKKLQVFEFSVGDKSGKIIFPNNLKFWNPKVHENKFLSDS